MTQKKTIALYSTFATLSSIAISLITSKAQILTTSNHLFLFSLFFLIISASLFVIRNGFFSNFVRSFKKFNRFGQDDLDILDHEDDETARKRDAIWQAVQIVSLVTGVFCLACSLLMLYLRY